MSIIENGRKRRFIAGIAAVIGAFAFTSTADAATRPAAADRSPKPTVVLEHGAFADGASWDGVITRLRHDGYPVVAAANPLRGPASDAAALRSLITHLNGRSSWSATPTAARSSARPATTTRRSGPWFTSPRSCRPPARPRFS